MNADDKHYTNHLEENLAFYDLYLNDYIKRLEFCRDNGCNTIMLTGNVEPQQNKRFLVDFGIMMRLMERPFRNIEMQTTGSLIDESMLRFLRNHIGVNTIALSLFSMDNAVNQQYKGNPPNSVDIKDFCGKVKKYDFNLRLCLTDAFDTFNAETLFKNCNDLGADQATLRKLYDADDGGGQSVWVKNHSIEPSRYEEFFEYTHKFKALRILEYGRTAFSISNMSVIVDDDCMAEDPKNVEFKYLILRPNGKLYGSWGDPASLIF